MSQNVASTILLSSDPVESPEPMHKTKQEFEPLQMSFKLVFPKIDELYCGCVVWCVDVICTDLIAVPGKTHLQSVRGVEWRQSQAQTFDNLVYYKSPKTKHM